MSRSFDVRLEYRDRNRGQAAHWFDVDTMRFFGTHLSGVELWCGPGRLDCIFTTSEKPPHGPRMYSIRHLDRDGEIHTIGEHCSFSRSVAIRMARELAKTGRTDVDAGRNSDPYLCSIFARLGCHGRTYYFAYGYTVQRCRSKWRVDLNGRYFGTVARLKDAARLLTPSEA